MLGTGGASRAAGLAAPRFGDCSRNVPIRSVMEPELSLRSSIELGRPFTDPLRELEIDARRCVRLVCTSATFVGVVGRDLRAAPAAAAARFAFDFCVDRKAKAAADVAEGSAPAPLTLRCYGNISLTIYPHFRRRLCASKSPVAKPKESISGHTGLLCALFLRWNMMKRAACVADKPLPLRR